MRHAFAFPHKMIVALGVVVMLADPSFARPKAAATPPRSLLEGVDLFQLDAPHSVIDFVVPWMGVSKVRGTFTGVNGMFTIDRADMTRSSATIVIRTATISTGNEARDKHLKSADFFDVEKYPVAVFRSTAVERRGDDYVLRGGLALHGVTKPVEIPFHVNGRVFDTFGDERIGFEGTLRLQRKDYGIVGPENFNRVLATGITIGEQVEMPLTLEGWRAIPHDSLQDRAADSLMRAIERSGVAASMKRYRAARATTPDSLMAVDEGTLNTLGYWYLGRDRAGDARAIFELEAESYPQSAFAWVGMAQAKAILGDRAGTTEAAEKALALNPNAVRAMEILKRLKSS